MDKDQKIGLGIAALVLLTTVPPVLKTMRPWMNRQIAFERAKKQDFTLEDGLKQTAAKVTYMRKAGYTSEEIRAAFVNDLKFLNIIVNQPHE